MIWLIGKSGMLGSAVARALTNAGLDFVGTGHEVDITDTRAIDAFIMKTEAGSILKRKIRWIINCAAYTDVNGCQSEEGAAAAKLLNVDAVLNIARIARNHGSRLIHISSDYVFDGKADKPYTETAERNPLSVYGQTKMAGEDAVTSSMSQYYIIRTSSLIGFTEPGSGKANLVTKLIKHAKSEPSIDVATDITIAPTFCEDLAAVIALIIDKSEKATSIFGKNSALSFGVYNFTNSGSVTIANFAKRVLDIALKGGLINGKCKINEVRAATRAQDASVAQRPSYAVLDCTKITKELRIKVPNWEVALHNYMTDKRFTTVE